MVTFMSPTVCVPPLFMAEICFTPFFLQPVAKFRNRNHHRIMFLGDFDGVADVIEVAVSAEHDIHVLNVLLFFRAHGIAHDPRIDQNGLCRPAFRCETWRGPAR